MAGAFRKGIVRFEVRIVTIFSHTDFEVGNSPFRFPAGARGLPLFLSLQTGSWNRPSLLQISTGGFSPEGTFNLI